MDIVRDVRKIIRQEKLILNGDRVLLAVSGGIDSTSLLFVLREIQPDLGFELGLAHINHQLRGAESDRDEEFVRNLARRFSLPIHVVAVDVKGYSSRMKLSIQHAGRELRYRAFDDISREYKYTKIAVAHNLDDQVETFLMRAVKGTGLRGLSAIPIKRGTIIRPFLYNYRSDIVEYAGKHSISFVEDSSNNKILYERNFLRREVLPLLERLNCAAKEKLSFLLKDIAAVNDYFEERAGEFLKQQSKAEGGLITFRVNDLRLLDKETLFRVISNTITSMEPSFIPLREHFRQIDGILLSEKPNLTSTLPCGIRVKRVYDHLYFTKDSPEPRNMESFPVGTGTNRLEQLSTRIVMSYPRKAPSAFSSNKNTAFFDAAQIKDLTIRTFRNGDKFVPLGLKDPVKLKDFFISSKVPREERRRIPLLISGNDIIWVIGYRIDERFKITGETKKVLKVCAARL